MVADHIVDRHMVDSPMTDQVAGIPADTEVVDTPADTEVAAGAGLSSSKDHSIHCPADPAFDKLYSSLHNRGRMENCFLAHFHICYKSFITFSSLSSIFKKIMLKKLPLYYNIIKHYRHFFLLCFCIILNQ